MQVHHVITAVVACYLCLTSTSAHTMCDSCIPLSNLLAEAYGIVFSADELSSAVAFHNGSATPTGVLAASSGYKSLMQPFLASAIDQDTQSRVLNCPDRYSRPQTSSFDKSFLDFVLATLHLPKRLWDSFSEQDLIQLPLLHPTASLIQEQILALPPFSDMAHERLSQLAVAVEIPSWLIGREEACHVVSAAERTFGRVVGLENTPSAAYTAAGYELCGISYDAFDCTGPGRLMTLEYDGNLAVASMMQTPLSDAVRFSVRVGLTPQDMTDWVNAFVDSEQPDMLMLAGTQAEDPTFVHSIANSHAAQYLEERQVIPPQHILALGAAQAAKDRLEQHGANCGEWEECTALRREADAISGTYNPLNPSVWPATGPRHMEL